jgi:hypothetical protein
MLGFSRKRTNLHEKYDYPANAYSMPARSETSVQEPTSSLPSQSCETRISAVLTAWSNFAAGMATPSTGEAKAEIRLRRRRW